MLMQLIFAGRHNSWQNNWFCLPASLVFYTARARWGILSCCGNIVNSPPAARQLCAHNAPLIVSPGRSHLDQYFSSGKLHWAPALWLRTASGRHIDLLARRRIGYRGGITYLVHKSTRISTTCPLRDIRPARCVSLTQLDLAESKPVAGASTRLATVAETWSKTAIIMVQCSAHASTVCPAFQEQ